MRFEVLSMTFAANGKKKFSFFPKHGETYRITSPKTDTLLWHAAVNYFIFYLFSFFFSFFFQGRTRREEKKYRLNIYLTCRQPPSNLNKQTSVLPVKLTCQSAFTVSQPLCVHWPIRMEFFRGIVSKSIRKKSRTWHFYIWSDKEMYNALFPWET